MKYLFLLFFLLQGCAIVSYKGTAMGDTTIYGFALGNTTALENGKFSIGADKSRSFELNKLNNNQSESLNKINEGLSLIIEGAVKGTK